MQTARRVLGVNRAAGAVLDVEDALGVRLIEQHAARLASPARKPAAKAKTAKDD